MIKGAAEDKESGITSLRYSITPTTGLPSGKNEGDLPQNGTPVEITSTAEETYTVTITATNGAGNTATKEITGVRTIDGITVSEAKTKINSSNIKDYIGTKVTDYNPPAGGIYRVFYYDENGYFGKENTVYLKRDHEGDNKVLENYISYNPSDGGELMKKMNPLWANSTNSSSINLYNEHCVAWLCDSAQWTDYKTDDSSFAIGSPSIEMYVRAFNIWKENDNKLICKIENANGFIVGANGEYVKNSIYGTVNNAIEGGPNGIFFNMSASCFWLSSPSYADQNCILTINSKGRTINGNLNYTASYGYWAVVPLDIDVH